MCYISLPFACDCSKQMGFTPLWLAHKEGGGASQSLAAIEEVRGARTENLRLSSARQSRAPRTPAMAGPAGPRRRGRSHDYTRDGDRGLEPRGYRSSVQ